MSVCAHEAQMFLHGVGFFPTALMHNGCMLNQLCRLCTITDLQEAPANESFSQLLCLQKILACLV